MVSKKRNLRKKNKRRTKKRKFFKKVKGKGKELLSRKNERQLLLDKLGKQYNIEIPNDIIDKIFDYTIKDDAARTIQKNTKTGFIVTLLLELLDDEEEYEEQNIDRFKKWCEEKLAYEVQLFGPKICGEKFIKKDEKTLFMMFIVDDVNQAEAEETVDTISFGNLDNNKYFFGAKKIKYMQLYGHLPCRTT